jgi:hypothetical protein
MAISTYSELQTAVANWLNRTDLTDRIPEFIALAEAQMNRRLRVRQMVTRAEAALASEFVDAPQDMLEPIRLTLEISESDIRMLQYLAPERLLAEKVGIVSSAEPAFYSMVGGSLQLLPMPDTTYTSELTYYARIAPLASNSTNWLLSAYPDAYLYGALLQAAPYLVDDERTVTWGTMFQAALNDIQMSNRVPAGNARTEVAGLVGRQSFNINAGV